MMGEQLRLCAACNTPSPGPIKRLYYQHRDYGPFFPILEEQRRESNDCLYSGGRVLTCTGCSSHLLRQWANYDKNWTPLEKRSYTLLSDERMARKAKKDSLLSKVSIGTNGYHVELHEQENYSSWKNNTGKRNSMNTRDPKVLNQKTSSDKVNSSGLNERLSPSSFISDDSTPFHRAVKKVSKQNTRILAEYEVNKQLESSHLENLEKQQWNDEKLQWNDEKQTENGVTGMPPSTRSLALWNLPSEDIRSQVREELQENIDVMIRKVAEIQHFENMRRYEQELKEAAERMCRVQHREGDIDRMCHSLKAQLQEELLFRDTVRVLNEEEDKKPLMSIEPSKPTNLTENHTDKRPSKQRLTGVTNAKKAGKEWKGKAARKKSKGKEGNGPTETSLALVPCPPEESASTSTQSNTERITSASRKLDGVVRELEKEREWRKRTESVISEQREMIEELRSGIHDEVQRLIDEQNKRYQEIKTHVQQPSEPKPNPNGLSRPSPYKNSYISQDRASSRDHDAMQDHEERRSRERRRPRRDRSRDERVYKGDVPSAVRKDNDKNKDHDDDDDDVTDDSDEQSSPATPEFYIQ